MVLLDKSPRKLLRAKMMFKTKRKISKILPKILKTNKLRIETSILL